MESYSLFSYDSSPLPTAKYNPTFKGQTLKGQQSWAELAYRVVAYLEGRNPFEKKSDEFEARVNAFKMQHGLSDGRKGRAGRKRKTADAGIGASDDEVGGDPGPGGTERGELIKFDWSQNFFS